MAVEEAPEVQRIPPRAPAKLGAKARKVWVETVKVYDLRQDELNALEDACREIDLIDRMEAEVSKGGLIVLGSQKQPVANPLVTEIRQHRMAVQRLLASLKLPEDPEEAAANRSAQMRAVVSHRWKRGA